MTIYADTSLVVAAYTAEVMSEPARTLLADIGDGDLRSSWWCETEIASALATKVRTGQMTERARYEASSAIESSLRQSATILPVGAHHFNAATALLERSTLVLRASDALHLAIAADDGSALWTLDRRMAEAGQALGLDTSLLS